MVSLNAANKVFAIFVLLLICIMPIEAKQQKEKVTNLGRLRDGREWSSFVPKKVAKNEFNAYGVLIDGQRILFNKNERVSFCGELNYKWQLKSYTFDSCYIGDELFFIIRSVRKNSKDYRGISEIYDKSGKRLYYYTTYISSKKPCWTLRVDNYSIGRAQFLFVKDGLYSKGERYYSYEGEYIGTKIEENHVFESPQVKFLKVYSGSDTYYGYMTYNGKWLAKPVSQNSFSDKGANHFEVKKFHGNGRYFFEHQKMVSLQNPQCVGKCFSWLDLETGETIIPFDINCESVDKYKDRDNLFVIRTLDGKYGLLNKDGKIIVRPTYSKMEFSNSNFLSVYDTSRGVRIVVKDVENMLNKLLDEQGEELYISSDPIKILIIEPYEYLQITENYRRWRSVHSILMDMEGNEVLKVKNYISVAWLNGRKVIEVGARDEFFRSQFYNPDLTPISNFPTKFSVFEIKAKFDILSGLYKYTFLSDGHMVIDKNLKKLFAVKDFKIKGNSAFEYGDLVYFYVYDGRDKRGLYDIKGNEILAPKYFDIQPNSSIENLASFTISIIDPSIEDDVWARALDVPKQKYGLASSIGKIIVPTEYDKIESLGSSLLKCTKEDKIGIYNFLGQEMLKPEYYSIEIWDNFNSNLLYLKKKEGSKHKYGIASSISGKIIIPAIYDDLWYMNGTKSYVRFKQNGYWGVMNLQGKVIIPTSRCYTEISYDSNKKVFAFSKDGGIKGECNNSGKQISLTKPTPPKNLASNNHSSSQAKQTSQSMPEGLLYKGYYTVGDGIDVETGMVFSGMNITNEIEIYEDYLKDVLVTANYKRTTSSGTRVYESSDPFGNPVTYYVTPSYEITLITDYYSYGFHNQVRTPYNKGQVTYSPTMNGNYGNSYNTSPNQSTNGYNSNPGLSAAQYQQNYNGYEDIVKGIFRTFEITGSDMPYGAKTQNLQTLRNSQNEMRRIRQEAASHGITIPQSYYETARP